MADQIKLTPGTFGSESFTDSFFAQLPSDGRFSKVSYIDVPPLTTLDKGNIYFTFPSWSSSSVYLFDKALMFVSMKLYGKDGKKLKDDSVCGPINLPLWSVFSEMRTYVGNTPLNSQNSNYHLKNYLETLITYNQDYKTRYFNPLVM